MYKTILLKTQLFEAAIFGKSSDYRKKRLAVILLDNFVEIQLRSLVDRRLSFDEIFGRIDVTRKKYKAREKKLIKKYHQNLLDVCKKENILSQDEASMVEFCHEIRNHLYHEINEEKLLVDVALIIFQEIILKKQPSWGNASFGTMHSGSEDEQDPFIDKRKRNRFSGPSTEDWEYFLKKFFKFVDRRKKGLPRTLSTYVLDRIQRCEENILFLESDAPKSFPAEKFNLYIQHYSFLNLRAHEIEMISESDDYETQLHKVQSVFDLYKEDWESVEKEDLKRMRSLAIKISKQNTIDALMTYAGLRKKLDLIYHALSSAAIELDKEIQLQIDIARGK